VTCRPPRPLDGQRVAKWRRLKRPVKTSVRASSCVADAPARARSARRGPPSSASTKGVGLRAAGVTSDTTPSSTHRRRECRRADAVMHQRTTPSRPIRRYSLDILAFGKPRFNPSYDRIVRCTAGVPQTPSAWSASCRPPSSRPTPGPENSPLVAFRSRGARQRRTRLVCLLDGAHRRRSRRARAPQRAAARQFRSSHSCTTRRPRRPEVVGERQRRAVARRLPRRALNSSSARPASQRLRNPSRKRDRPTPETAHRRSIARSAERVDAKASRSPPTQVPTILRSVSPRRKPPCAPSRCVPAVIGLRFKVIA